MNTLPRSSLSTKPSANAIKMPGTKKMAHVLDRPNSRLLSLPAMISQGAMTNTVNTAKNDTAMPTAKRVTHFGA